MDGSRPRTVSNGGEHAAGGHCSARVRLEMLGRAPLFGSLDEAALGRVNEQCRAVACSPGAVVYREGDPAERLYVVATGAVKLVRHGADGTPVLHDVVAPGETFGSLYALGDDLLTHEAVALRPGCLLLLTADAFHHVMRTEPGVAEAALRLTANRLREAQGTVQALSTLPVEGRLAATLLRLARKVGQEDGGGMHLGVAPTQVDLAAMTGTSPESVSRVFARWRAQGWVATGPGGPVLRDLEALGRMAEGVA
ncbi:MAG: Crp/Fnr family transcriptional regulator [Trueperaceae bacterium]|nr:Crp/Fnr family transcriptional regulator [Trueperaceae bacterium]